jgi:preprotein translocase subunit SecY
MVHADLRCNGNWLTFLYTALIFNPKQIADDLKRNNGFIPGVKPGQPTADYIGSVMDKITLPGAILLAFVGILPGFRATVWCAAIFLFIFWRYFIADYGGSGA